MNKRALADKLLIVILAVVAVALVLRAMWKGKPTPPSGSSAPVLQQMVPPKLSGIPQGAPQSFSDIAAVMEPVVVNIFTTQKVHSQSLFPFFQLPEREQHSLGSGFVISPDGYILTNHHVVAEADEIRVQFTDKREYLARFVGSDAQTDIALIKIEDSKREFPTAVLGDSDELKVGDWVVAVGNPFGLGGTVTAGIVSAKGRFIRQSQYDNFIQTDASINPGNSGGPLVNIKGEVVGINSAIFSPSGGNVGIGFAIPINLAKKIIPQLKAQGKVTRAWLGVAVQPLTPELAESFGLPSARGAVIAQVYPGTPAEKAGLKEDDIVTEVDGKPIEDHSDLMRTVSLSPVGSTVSLTVIRKGNPIKINVTLAARPEESDVSMMAGQGGTTSIRSNLLGVQVSPLTADQARSLGLTGGVAITAINRSGPAYLGGLMVGDVIVNINGEDIASMDDFQRVAQKLSSGQIVRIKVLRGNTRIFTAFRIP